MLHVIKSDKSSYIRSYVMLSLLLTLSVIVVLNAIHILHDVNTLLVSLQKPLTLQEYYSIKQDFGDEISAYYRYGNLNVSGIARSLSGVSIYGCDGQFGQFSNIEMVHGRFLWNSDIPEEKAFAVIDENVAIALFSRTECIGRSIYILGQEYSIVGVCKGSVGLWDAWTGVDKYAVYLPYGHGPVQLSTGGVLFSSNSPSLLDSRAQLLGPLYYISVIDNLAMRSRMISMIGRFSLLFLWIIALVAYIRFAYRYIKLKFSKIQSDVISRYYLTGYIRKHTVGTLLLLIAAVASLLVFAVWFKAVSFEPEIDPKLLPVPLNDLDGWKENLSVYFYSANTKVTVPYRNAILIEKIKWIITTASVSMFISAKLLLNKLLHFLTNKILNKTSFFS